jgi:hypothetical protein
MLANKTYVGDTGTAIELDTEAVLTASNVSIKAQKPNGTVVTWPATATGTVVRYLTEAGDLDMPGQWKFQALVENSAGQWLGATVKLRVYAAFD